MYWIEEKDEESFVVPDDVVDVAFAIRCKALPVDHAHALSEAVKAALPWFAGEPGAGLHLIHGAESGNGWYRPEDGAEMLYLSRRTKLTLRLPRHRVEEAVHALEGVDLDVAGHGLALKEAEIRKLSPLASMYARHVAGEGVEDEERFLQWAVGELQRSGLSFKKVLSGRDARFAVPGGVVKTRSLLVAGLDKADAVRLQEIGVGPHRHMGFGVFIPHKNV